MSYGQVNSNLGGMYPPKTEFRNDESSLLMLSISHNAAKGSVGGIWHMVRLIIYIIIPRMNPPCLTSIGGRVKILTITLR